MIRVTTAEFECRLSECKSKCKHSSPGNSSGGLEAAAVLRNHRGHGDPSSHHAGGDRTVGPVHAVQHPEEVDDRERVPQAGQQQEVSGSPVQRQSF